MRRGGGGDEKANPGGSGGLYPNLDDGISGPHGRAGPLGLGACPGGGARQPEQGRGEPARVGGRGGAPGRAGEGDGTRPHPPRSWRQRPLRGRPAPGLERAEDDRRRVVRVRRGRGADGARGALRQPRAGPRREARRPRGGAGRSARGGGGRTALRPERRAQRARRLRQAPEPARRHRARARRERDRAHLDRRREVAMLKMMLIGAVAVPAIAAGAVAATGVVVVDVQERAGGHHIVVPVPLALAQVAAAFVPESKSHVRLPAEAERYLPVARDVLTALAEAEDAELV